MTPQEVIEEIKYFSIDEKNFIIQQISQSIHQNSQNDDSHGEDEKRELTINDKIAIVENLYGSLRVEGKYTPITKAEEREMRLEYLMEKYS